MRMHVFRHEEFENEAGIGTWALKRGWQVSGTDFFAGQQPPEPDEYDWLVVMGGAMNIYEGDKYQWLEREKLAIGRAIEADKVVLGVCLGAQLIADVLGGPVTRGPYREIGWHPVELAAQAKTTTPFANFPDTFTAFHWHGDTFAIPPGAVHAASTPGCANQAFVFHDKVVGVQFHMETTGASMESLITACENEIEAGLAESGEWVQDARAMRDGAPDGLAQIGPLLRLMLDNLAGSYS